MTIDEFWYFANEKNTVWLWRAIDGISRRALGWKFGNRTDVCREVDTGKCDFVTDNWSGFFRVLPEERYFQEKDLTYLHRSDTF